MVSLNSILAKCYPIQFLGPLLKGIYVKGYKFLTKLSSNHLFILNYSGFSKVKGLF